MSMCVVIEMYEDNKKEYLEVLNQRQKMIKESENSKTTIYKTLDITPNIEQHKPHQSSGANQLYKWRVC